MNDVVVHTQTESRVVVARTAQQIVVVREPVARVTSRQDAHRVHVAELVNRVVAVPAPRTTILAAGAQGPAGVQGEAGPPGADGNGNIEVPFSWGDATPALLGAVDGVVVAVSIIVLTPFNGAGAAITVGTLADPDLLMTAAQNFPEEAGRYESNPGIEVAASVYLTITPGGGASAGAGIVYIETA